MNTQKNDFADLITHACLCGSKVFNLKVIFEEYQIAAYMLDMSCVECNAHYTAPTPIDNPEYEE